jgi:copper chaperone CopZ
MPVMRRSFVVEQAGCASCAARVRLALADVVRVDGIEIDDDADTAFVRVSGDDVSKRRVEAAIDAASEGSGHTYRIRAGSWGG